MKQKLQGQEYSYRSKQHPTSHPDPCPAYSFHSEFITLPLLKVALSGSGTCHCKWHFAVAVAKVALSGSSVALRTLILL